jgi:PAS domain S-box-containing protein
MSSPELWIFDRDGAPRDTPPPEQASALSALVRQFVATGAPARAHLPPSNGSRAIDVALRCLPGDDVAVVVADSSVEQDLLRGLSRYELVLRATRDAIWEWDIVANKAWWNGRQHEMLGFSPDVEPSYEAWASRIHPDDRDHVVRGFEQVLGGLGATWEDEFRVIRTDGEVRRVLDRGYVERDASGRPIRAIGVTRDITEERSAVEALRQSEERFRELTDAIDEVFWLVDPATDKILYVSPAYEKVFGRPVSTVYASLGAFLDTIHEDDRVRVEQRLFAERETGRYDETYRIRRPDGSVAWVRDRGFPIRDSHGNVVRVAGVALDITSQRRLEEQLLQAQKLESIGRLAGGVAHDFNNLLTVIMTSIQFAMRAIGNSPAREDLREIEEAAARAARLTGQLLAFARRQIISPVRLDLNRVTREIESLLRRLLGEHIELDILLASEIGLVRADPAQMEQIIVNLAINARDAMPSGGRLTIETQNLTVDEKFAAHHPQVALGDYVQLAVSDTGTGMTPELRAHIFEPFFTSKHEHGTGLGLATCYGIVTQAGGQILVYSEPGRGSVFKVLLPRIAGAAGTDGGAVQPLARGGSETILFVEDDAPVRRVGTRCLVEAGYHVLEAASGPEALGLAAAHPGVIHLLVTDVVMPSMEGTELARLLVRDRPDLRVLFSSGYTERTVARDENGAASFLAKPYIPQRLLAKVREILDKS